MSRILIAGAGGQVGRTLTAKLQAGPYNVLALDRAALDITDIDAVRAAVQAYQPDIIMNCAAYTAVDKAESEPEQAYAINRDGAANLAAAAHAADALFIHLSTDYVFDGKGDAPYGENDAAAPQSVYGASKLAGEQAVLAKQPKSIILRTAWIFGEHGANFVKTMLRLGRERDALSIVADQYGGPTYAGDIADAMIRIAAASQQQYGIYHYSGQPYVSWYEFAQHIFAAAEVQQLLNPPVLTAISTDGYPTPAKRPSNSRLNLAKIEQDYGIMPSNWQGALTDLFPYLTL